MLDDDDDEPRSIGPEFQNGWMSMSCKLRDSIGNRCTKTPHCSKTTSLLTITIKNILK